MDGWERLHYILAGAGLGLAIALWHASNPVVSGVGEVLGMTLGGAFTANIICGLVDERLRARRGKARAEKAWEDPSSDDTRDDPASRTP